MVMPSPCQNWNKNFLLGKERNKRKKTKRKQNHDNNSTYLKALINKQGNKKNKTTAKKKQMKTKQNKQKKNKIIQLLTVGPELVTLDCSLTHVL